MGEGARGHPVLRVRRGGGEIGGRVRRWAREWLRRRAVRRDRRSCAARRPIQAGRKVGQATGRDAYAGWGGLGRESSRRRLRIGNIVWERVT